MRPGGRRVAVIGAGLAGAWCAQGLQEAGWSVVVFDKARGVGGRMSTRRACWRGDDGQSQTTALDHGAAGFVVTPGPFGEAVAHAQAAGLLQPWRPRLAPGSQGLRPDGLWAVATPDMPAWCRALVSGLPVHTGCTVQALVRDTGAWVLHVNDAAWAEAFDAVVVALPPAQAAPLLQAHRADWAERMQALPMRPCWTLMGVTDAPGQAWDWDLHLPPGGPLARLMRQDHRPGRRPVAGQAHWVAQATPAWSAAHLEAPAEQVQALLQQATDALWGVPLRWHHAVVHRWRYAVAAAASVPEGGPAWWDEPLGLGVCGDALGTDPGAHPAGDGVPAAWRSGQALVRCMAGPADACPHPVPPAVPHWRSHHPATPATPATHATHADQA